MTQFLGVFVDDPAWFHAWVMYHEGTMSMCPINTRDDWLDFPYTEYRL